MARPSGPGSSRQSILQPYSTAVGLIAGILTAGVLVPMVFDQADDGPDERTTVRFQDAAGPSTTTDGSVGTGGTDPVRRAEGASGSSSPQASPRSETQPTGNEEGPAQPTAAPAEQNTLEPAEEDSTPAELTASDRGVTPDTVKLGIILLDIAGVGDFGLEVGVGPEAQQRGYDAFIDHVNANGGVHGRMIEPVYTSYDPVDMDTGRAACRRMTEDEQVFTVLGFAQMGDSQLCITEQKDTPLINSMGTMEEWHDQANGLLFDTAQSWTRGGANTVAHLDERGVFDDRTIGVVTSRTAFYYLGIEGGLLPLLQERHGVKRYTVLPADLHARSAQIPLEVQQMRSEGIDLVVEAIGALGSPDFWQQAHAQRYRPLGVMPPIAGQSTGDLGNYPDTLDAVGVNTSRENDWRLDIPEPEFDVRCREIYAEQTGIEVERGTEADDEHAITGPCNQVLSLFVRGAEAAGPELTRRGLSDALQSLGEVKIAGAGSGSLEPGKFDASDEVRAVQADMDCECWMPISEFEQPLFSRWGR